MAGSTDGVEIPYNGIDDDCDLTTLDDDLDGDGFAVWEGMTATTPTRTAIPTPTRPVTSST